MPQIITIKISDDNKLVGASATFDKPQTITVGGQSRTIAPGMAVPIDSAKLKTLLGNATAAALTKVEELQADKTALQAQVKEHGERAKQLVADIEAAGSDPDKLRAIAHMQKLSKAARKAQAIDAKIAELQKEKAALERTDGNSTPTPAPTTGNG